MGHGPKEKIEHVRQDFSKRVFSHFRYHVSIYDVTSAIWQWWHLASFVHSRRKWWHDVHPYICQWGRAGHPLLFWDASSPSLTVYMWKFPWARKLQLLALRANLFHYIIYFIYCKNKSGLSYLKITSSCNTTRHWTTNCSRWSDQQSGISLPWQCDY